MTSTPSDTRCLVVVGPTATGKTRLGIELARKFDGEIISVDSRQFYRGMDIGTGKDLAEYGRGSSAVPYHLIDILHPNDEYHLYQFIQDAHTVVADLEARGKLPVFVGGTALYVNALLDQYRMEGGAPDPDLRKELEQLSDEQLLTRLRDQAADVYERTDKTQRKRIIRAVEIAESRETAPAAASRRLSALLLGPFYPRPEIHKRIEQRLDARLREGLVDEVQRLHDNGVSWERLDFFGLEYRYAAQYLRGELDAKAFRDTLLARIRRLCKSQEIWFRKMEREGKTIYWIPEGDSEKASAITEKFLNGTPLPAPEIQLRNRLYGPQTN